ncbi:hypothetical protein FRC17_010568 [Serendipita sp. 399]|nr:hypothetical protein FRC17_010568 [Serendipita sp. 399]
MSTTSVSRPFTEVNPSLTASRASGYVPPAATASGNGHSVATTRPHIPNPSTPAFINDFQWINSYLFIHKMSTPSYRYSFLLWIFIVFVVLIVAILHWTGSRGGYVGAAWSKWALRRRTWRKKHTLAQAKREGKPHQQPFSFPSNAQMLSLIVLFLVPLVLCVVGPDYIAPGTKLWDLTHNVTKRALDDVFIQRDLMSRAASGQVASTATTRAPEYTVPKAWWTVGGRTGIIAFSLFPLVVLFSLKAPPFAVFAIPFLIQVHFDKLARLHRWTGRLIWIITTIHVVTWGIQLFRDKRGSGNPAHRNSSAWLFVWQYPLFIEGFIAYVALTALCVLSLDSFRVRNYEAFYVLHVILVPVTLVFSALHFPTIWWWCWSALFLWVGERLYRAVRWSYVNGLMGKGKIPIGAAPPPMKNSMASLVEKKPPSVGGRLNEWEQGVRVVPNDTNPNTTTNQRTRMDRNYSDFSYESGHHSAGHNFPQDSYNNWEPRTMASRNSSYYGREEEVRASLGSMGSQADLLPQYPLQPQSPVSARPLVDHRHQSDNASLRYPPTINGANASPNHTTRYSRIPPPGFAIAQLLPGRVVRLRLLTPRPITWAPGQHVLLQVPSISKYTTHPFTISGCYDDESETGEGRVVELLIRAKNGFTKDLWEEVVRLVNESDLPSKASDPFSDRRDAGDIEGGYGVGIGHNKEKTPGGVIAKKAGNENAGVLIRAFVDGPFGSSIRAHWGNHSSVLIVVGGTGVTFGVSILEYLCLCLAGRDGKSLGGRPGGWGHQGFKTSRVRFIWLVREFSHIQWCATVIRRCMEMVPSSALQVDIYVSNADLTSYRNPNRNSVFTENGGEELAPPSARFMRRQRTASNSSVDSLVSANTAMNSAVDLSYLQQTDSAYGGMDYYHSNELGHESHVLDFTNFDGEDDTRVPGEAKMSKRVQKEGKIRRAKSRRAAAASNAKTELESRSRQGTAHHGAASGRTSPPPTGLPQGAYSPISASQTSPNTYDPRYVTSAADQYRSPDALLSPTDLAAQRRWSAASLSAMRAPSPLYAQGHDGLHAGNRLSVASMGDLGRGVSPSPGPGAENIHRLVVGERLERPESVVESVLDSYVKLEIDDQELDDLHVVAEMARPGKPKLERVLADEVGRARGALAVACCGPASLNALVRKMVAMQINPKQVLHGEMQGMISLITEEFQW